jgi:3-oxoacyl-[acyl-carrier-protein] synthase II
MRRVVVTGLGLVTPLATGVEETWSRLLAGSPVRGRSRGSTRRHATTYACEVKRGDGTDGTFNPDDWMEPKEQRKVDEFILYGMAAADQAIKDAGWTPTEATEARSGRAA